MKLVFVIAIAIIGAVDSACYSFSCSDSLWDCWAGSDTDPCTCFHGLEARETGKTKDAWMGFDTVELFEYECCDIGTGGAHRDGTCGDYETDDNGCTQTKCTSPANTPGGDCYAGTTSEGCTCSDGWTAVETGISGLGYNGKVYYEYTCCPSGGTADGTCGDFDPSDGFDATIIVIIGAVIVILVIVGTACYFGRRRRQRKRLASKMMMINPAQPAAFAEGMNPPQAIQGMYVQNTSPMDASKDYPMQTMGAKQQVLFAPPAAPQMAGPVPQMMLVQQPPQMMMVMGQNGQWMMQQPQWVQQIQSQQGVALAQQQVQQQTQFAYQAQEGTDANVAQTSLNQQIPMQQFQYVPKQGPSGDKSK